MSDLPDLAPATAAQRVAIPDGAIPPAAPRDVTPAFVGLRFRAQDHADVSSLNPELTARANRLYEMMPPELQSQATVTSGRRSTAEQARLYADYQAGGGLAARPGHSQHELGAALDFNASSPAALKWLTENAPKVGLEFPFGGKDPGHMQLSEAGSKSASVVDRKRLAGIDDLPDLPAVGTASSASPAGSAVSQSELMTIEDQIPTGGTQEYSRASAALLHGITRGMVEPALAVAQMTLPREQMTPIEARLRQVESDYADLRDEHPTLEQIGRLTGATVTIMGAARLLGGAAPSLMPLMAAKAAQAAWQGIGAVGRGVATGASVGALSFYPEGPEAESRPLGVNARAFDTGVGSVLGLIGGTVARSLEWGARNLSDTAYGRSFMRLVQQTTNGTARNTGQAQTEALSYYGQVTATSRANYAVRNAAGREIEGFPTGVGPAGSDEGFTQAIDRAIQENKDEGVKSWVEGVARGVKKTLGVDKEEGRYAEWQRLQKEYEDGQAKLGFEPLRPNLSPAQVAVEMRKREQMTAAYGGGVSAPPSFVASPVPSEAYAQARTEINAAIGRAVRSKNSAVETQLGMMLRGIDKVAEDTARAEGISTETFVRRREAADKYFKENVVPLQKFFDGKKFARATQPVEQGGITTAAIYDNIAAVVNKDDVELARALGKTLGPRGRDSMVQVMAAEALRASELKGEGKAIEYVLKHQNVIRELIGRDAMTELEGMAKVAGNLVERVKARSPKIFDWSHSVAPVFVVGALFSRHYLHAAQMALTLPAYHIGLAALQRIHQTPIAKNLMRSAARLKPGSVELDALVDRTEAVIRKAVAIEARGASQEMQTRQ